MSVPALRVAWVPTPVVVDVPVPGAPHQQFAYAGWTHPDVPGLAVARHTGYSIVHVPSQWDIKRGLTFEDACAAILAVAPLMDWRGPLPDGIPAGVRARIVEVLSASAGQRLIALEDTLAQLPPTAARTRRRLQAQVEREQTRLGWIAGFPAFRHLP